MIQMIREHKKVAIITATAILVCTVLLAVFFSSQIKSKKREEVPQGRIHDAGVLGEDIVVHDSANGEIVISANPKINDMEIETDSAPLSAPLKTIADPGDIWSVNTYAGNHTPVEIAQMKDGSIGVLTIDKLNLSVNVYESADTMEAMSKGVAHFPSTSAWDSNVGLSAHNVNFDGSDGYFRYLYMLEKNDGISYKTALGERTYIVESVSTIAASDWTPLYYTDSNKLTLISCISNQPDKRLCVQAVEKPD